MKKHLLTSILISSLFAIYFFCWQTHALQADETITPPDKITSAIEDISKLNKSDLNSVLGAVGAPQAGGSLDIMKILSYFIFGGIGFVAFIYGKKNSLFRAMVLGIALNVYPYFISSTLLIYVVGIALTALLFIWRD